MVNITFLLKVINNQWFMIFNIVFEKVGTTVAKLLSK